MSKKTKKTNKAEENWWLSSNNKTRLIERKVAHFCFPSSYLRGPIMPPRLRGGGTCPELPSGDSGGDSKACLRRSLGTLAGQWVLQYSRWLLERSSVWPICTWSFTLLTMATKGFPQQTCVTESVTVFLHGSLETGWTCHAYLLWQMRLVLPTTNTTLLQIQKIGFHQIWSESGKSQFFSNVGRVWRDDRQKRIRSPDLRSHTIWCCDSPNSFQSDQTVTVGSGDELCITILLLHGLFPALNQHIFRVTADCLWTDCHFFSLGWGDVL